MTLLKTKTNIIRTYAGYYREDQALKSSSSGGVATYIAKVIVGDGGVVYGATYADDFYSAHYLRVSNIKDIDRLKGSKYCFVRKVILKNGQEKSVYEAVAEDVTEGRKILFIGLSCDIAALLHYLESKSIPEFREMIFTIELLCMGVTEEIVQREYVRYIESLHKSKVKSFTVRSKRDGWNPIYINAKFENEEEHVMPFYESTYGLAFMFYKRRACYKCELKGKHRYADLTIGDYRGCEEWMPEFNRDGVSIIFVQTENGQKMIDGIDFKIFKIMETDTEYACRHSPRYFSALPENPEWEEINRSINSVSGLFGTFRKRNYLFEYGESFVGKDIVLWGAGDCFHKLGHYVMEFTDVSFVVDENPDIWSQYTEYGIKCMSPEHIRGKDVFVIIMIEAGNFVCQVINRLINMNIYSFAHVRDWIEFNERIKSNHTREP